MDLLDAGTGNGKTYYVEMISNSTVSHFHSNPDEGAFLSFWVKGETQMATSDFCREAIPEELLWVEDGWTVLYGSSPLGYKAVTDDDCTYLFFNYTIPSVNVFTTITINGTRGIPESPSLTLLPFIMTFAVFVCMKRKTRGKGRVERADIYVIKLTCKRLKERFGFFSSRWRKFGNLV